jgi:RNA polymerase sigma-70 factor (ECF subfamily)
MLAGSCPAGVAEQAGPPMDEQVFRRFYERTARPLRAYITRTSGSIELADDLLQETYFRYLRSGFEGNDENHRRNYLFRIATNLVCDHFRRRRPETQELSEDHGKACDERPTDLRADMSSALATLSTRDRQLLCLIYVEGASHREAANILGLKASSIRSMLFRARQRLAARLRAGGFGPQREVPR